MTEAGRVAERGSIGKACFATGVVSLLATFSGVPLLFGLVLGDYFPAPIDWYVFVASGSIGLALALPAFALGVLGLRIEGNRSLPYVMIGMAFALIGAVGSGLLFVA